MKIPINKLSPKNTRRFIDYLGSELTEIGAGEAKVPV